MVSLRGCRETGLREREKRKGVWGGGEMESEERRWDREGDRDERGIEREERERDGKAVVHGPRGPPSPPLGTFADIYFWKL
jgi:hypothetical protein